MDELRRLLFEAQNVRHRSSKSVNPKTAPPPSERSDTTHSSDDQLALHDAENPLQLLARASDLRLGSSQKHDNALGHLAPNFWNDGMEQTDASQFFSPMKMKTDQGPHLDPIELGLVSAEEAEMLLS